MAKIALGIVVSQIRGKAGGAVFTKGLSGNTLRIRVRPSNPKTGAQNSVRAAFKLAAQTFKGFSPTVVATWRTYAASITRHNGVSGTAYHPSAISVFIALTSKFLQITPGGTIPTTPPASPYEPDGITIAAAGGVLKIVYTPSASNVSGSKTELLYQKLASENRKPSSLAQKHDKFTVMAGTTPVDSNALAPGFYIPAYRFVKTATGEEGPIVTLPVVEVTAS